MFCVQCLTKTLLFYLCTWYKAISLIKTEGKWLVEASSVLKLAHTELRTAGH